MNDVLALPFDQYQRYRLVADLLDRLRPRGARLRVLDVGGRTALLRRFLPQDKVALVDLEPSHESGLVQGDGSRLPFADASFDAVCAFDTLEHVPVARRAEFVKECARVAHGWVILAGPYQSPAVEEAEKLLQRFLKDKLAVEHRYLEEHRHHGLPDREETEALLRAAGAEVGSYGHGNLERWLALMCMSMYMDYAPPLRAQAERFQRFYNGRLYESDAGLPVYRHAVVAALHGARLPEHKRPSMAHAPQGATKALLEFASDVIAFDARRDVYEAEWKRLASVVLGLEQDLAGHRASLEEIRLRRAEQAGVIATLEADLAGHKADKLALESELEAFRRVQAAHATDLAAHARVIEELRELSAGYVGALEQLKTLLERERGEFRDVRGELEHALESTRRVVATLERDLGQHKHVVRDLESDLQGHRDTLAAERAQSSALRAEQERLLGELSRSGHALAGARGELEDAARHMAEQDQKIRLLRAELRHRWKSLKRALGPRRPTT